MLFFFPFDGNTMWTTVAFWVEIVFSPLVPKQDPEAILCCEKMQKPFFHILRGKILWNISCRNVGIECEVVFGVSFLSKHFLTCSVLKFLFVHVLETISEFQKCKISLPLRSKLRMRVGKKLNRKLLWKCPQQKFWNIFFTWYGVSGLNGNLG